MISFESDYICGAHPRILERLAETNMEHLPGYGEDKYCASAREKILEVCGIPEGDVRFIAGGTQTNAIVIAAMLRDFEGVISANTGHINAHEAGAVEYTGHKILPLPHKEGKIAAADIDRYISVFYEDASREHMVYPGMVYISHPTEYGTLYTLDELTAISGVCRKYNIPLFMDGARLGYGLMSRRTDVTIRDIARLCDVFYIGGTKVGALCGEAVVFTRGNTPPHFVNAIKKRGALLAKGRLIGVQFDTLFTNDLYFEVSRHAIEMAERLVALFTRAGFPFFMDSPTNQQFVILENSMMATLSEKVRFSYWEKYDESHTVVRFATSWSTTEEDMTFLEETVMAAVKGI